MHSRLSARHVRASRILILCACVIVTRPAGGQVSDSARADTGRLERVIVRAIRGGEAAPIAQTTIDRATIRRRHYAQDVPLLLQGAIPSLTAHTETGTPWGYSYLRLRGMDQTRLNITLDGVPLNDPEDQVLYFANFVDLMSSVRSVQVQRGVGTSSAGTASFAGSLNLETMPIARDRAGGELQLQAGSFASRRISVGAHSGLFANGLAVQARIGGVQTNGYRRHSGVAGGTAFLGAGWFGTRDVVKLTALAGLLSDTLSYVGATTAELAQDRRFNPLNPDERDRFTQQMLAVTHTRSLGARTSVSTTAYRNSAAGSYDSFALPDRYRYNLQHWWYGMTSALNADRGAWRVHAGVNASTYERSHRSYLEPSTPLYDNTGHKDDASAFAKVSLGSGRVRWFGDVQGRWARFGYQPDVNAGVEPRSTSWTFFNPKAGVTVELQPGVALQGSYGLTSREPARSDLFAGEDDLNAGNEDDYGDFSRVKPESVRDLEAGITVTRPKLDMAFNVYAMEFRNDIARIGPPSASGYALRRNVGSSYRRGVELDATWRGLPRTAIGGNASWSRNRIRSFTDSSTGAPVEFRDVEPVMSPSFISTQRVEVAVSSPVTVSWEGRYQSRAWLDNTNLPDRSIGASYVMDAVLRVSRRNTALTIRGANLADRLAFGSGSVSGTEVRYFVIPPRSIHVILEQRW